MLLPVVLVLLFVEVVLQFMVTRLSEDLITISEFPRVADALTVAEQDGKNSILFIGNSMVRDNIDLEILSTEVNERQNYYFAKCTADATAITDWYFTYKRYFSNVGKCPKTLVICFSGFRNVGDELPIVPRRLAHYFCAHQDLPELLFQEARTFDERAVCLIARFSSAFANVDRVQARIMYNLIPDYSVTAQRINNVASRRVASVRQQRDRDGDKELNRLQRFVSEAESRGVRVVLVAMQRVSPYEIDPSILSLVASRGIDLIDLRQVPGITDEMIPDGLHMKDEAAALYSRALAAEIDRLHTP